MKTSVISNFQGSSDAVRTLTLVSPLGAGQPGIAKFSTFQTRAQSSIKEHARELQQVIDVVPQHMFIL
ncbi:MAG: hypothetical protein ABSE86_20450, partial [Bryobacteraceae bacterium]